MLTGASLFVLFIGVVSTISVSASKCCSEGEVLVFNETNVTCDGSPEFYYFNNCTEETEFCEDVDAKGFVNKVFCNGNYENTMQIAISKCCPPNMSYNRYNHSCEENEIISNQYVDFIGRIGLSQCGGDKVIMDYIREEQSAIVNGTIRLNGLKFEADQFCLDREATSGKHVIRVCISNEMCGVSVPCLRKCCPDGQHYGLDRTCQRYFQAGVDWENLPGDSQRHTGNFGIIHGSTCKKYAASPSIQYKVDEWGNLHLREKGVLKVYKPYEEMYCVEHVQYPDSQLNGDRVLLCVLPPTQKFFYTRVAMVISCVFIALTITVYLWLQEKRNLFSKTLISYCVSLFLMYTNLAYVQFNTYIPVAACTGIAYSVTFFAISTFVWMNVMCIDIWLTFGSPNNLLTVSQKKKERKRFIQYSLYGWGFPAALVLFTFFAQNYDFLPISFRPILGERKCLLVSDTGNYYKLVFYVIPITVLKVVDLILFILTIIHCMKIKNAINEMKDSRSLDKKRWFIADKERLNLLLKLFVVMGVSWLSEALTSMIRFDTHPVLSYIESAFDVFNCFQGVLIFIIFACKREIFLSFKKKVFAQKLRRTSLSSCITQSSTLINKNFNRLNTVK